MIQSENTNNDKNDKEQEQHIQLENEMINYNNNENDHDDNYDDEDQFENQDLDEHSDFCEEEYKQPFKKNSVQEESYEADYQHTTVYHRGENNGRHMNEYEFLEKLGKGSFGKVKKVERKYLDGDGVTILKSFYAAKIFNKNQLEYERVFGYNSEGESFMTNRLLLIYEELKIYKHLNHPNICKLYQIIDDDTDEKLYMIMEYCDLSQLMTWNEDDQKYDPNTKLDNFICEQYNISEQDIYKRREMQAKIIFKQIAQGIRYLHSKNIVNRDIKIDNIICKSDEQKGEQFKLADFTTAKQLEKDDQKLKDCAGTNGFRCPEQQFNLDIGYDGKACDIWSLGISIITYINHKIPFWADSNLQTDISAKNDPMPYQPHNSNLLKDLIDSMCQKQEDHRIKIDQVIAHPFFN